METKPTTKTETNSFLMGITPGEAGGIATFINGEFACQPLPASEAGLVEYLRSLKRSADSAGVKPRCLVDQVGPVPIQQTERFRILLGVLLTLDFRIELVRTADWEAPLRQNPKWRDLTPHEFNAKLLKATANFFPNLEITPGTAVALILLLSAISKTNSPSPTGPILT